MGLNLPRFAYIESEVVEAGCQDAEDEEDETEEDDFEEDLSVLGGSSCFVSTRGGGGLTGLFAGSSLDQSSRDWFLGGGGGFPGLTATCCALLDNGDRAALEPSFLEPEESG